MRFQPPFCPSSRCPSHQGTPFTYQRKGYYHRKCDGRLVQRYLCLACHQGFSSQTFRLDYRLHRPELTVPAFRDFVSKVTHRQSARTLGCARHTIEHRLRLVGRHCQRFHARELGTALRKGSILGRFLFDELETFEGNRRLCPVTLAVLIERRSLFVLSLESAPLPARGRLSEANRLRKKIRERVHGKRKSGSTRIVNAAFELLGKTQEERKFVHVQTDRKKTYVTALKRHLGSKVLHERIDSRDRRDRSNPLFPINHTLAMMRDGISRLVRRNWGAAKLRTRLDLHAWIWAVYRNYVRGVTNRARRVTPAMSVGVNEKQWRPVDLLRWRIFPSSY